MEHRSCREDHHRVVAHSFALVEEGKVVAHSFALAEEGKVVVAHKVDLNSSVQLDKAPGHRQHHKTVD